MTKKLVTSALVYSNGPLHIGHLVEYIQTDIFVRFLRLKGEEVIFCCADDTHGAPIQINAEKQGISPEEMIGKYLKEHKRDFKKFNVSFDNYYTTNSDENKHYADLMFDRAKKAGHIYKKEINQLFCPEDKMFLPDRYVKGKCPKCGEEDQYGDVCEKCGTTYKPTELEGPYCSLCKTVPVNKKSEHYFFKLSAFNDVLEDWLKNPKLQKEVVNSVSQWIKDGLQDWDITRDGPYFGFKIPGEDNLYYYVWWDAPIGYIASAENLLQRTGQNAQDYWKDAEIIHFIGKDIIYFHFLFWPAVLKSSGFKLPNHINVHGFLTVNGEKMSKSRGTFFTAEEFAEKYEPEHLRYYYAASLGRKLTDIDLSFDDFTARINNELVANIGNFCFRTISFANKNFNGELKSIDYDSELMRDIEAKIKKVEESYQTLDFMEAVRQILRISALGNKFFQDKQPWNLVKQEPEKCREVLCMCANIAKNIAVLMSPIMPELADNLAKQLNTKLSWDELGFNMENHKLGKENLLVRKIEKKKKEVLPFNLKVGEILEIREHPEADKLLVIQVNLGTEKRQIVAGLKPHYPDFNELKGKKIIVVTNLKPAKLRGEESQGMLLAAQHSDKVMVIEPDAKPGTQVQIKGHEISSEQLKIDKFMKLNKMTIKQGKLFFEQHALLTDDKEIYSAMPDGSTVR